MQNSKNTVLVITMLLISTSPLVAMSQELVLAGAAAAGAATLGFGQLVFGGETVGVSKDQYTGYVQRNASRLKAHQARHLALINTALLSHTDTGLNPDTLTPRSKEVFADSMAAINTLPEDTKETKGTETQTLRELVLKMAAPATPLAPKAENKIMMSADDARALATQLQSLLVAKPEEKKRPATPDSAVDFLTSLRTSDLGDNPNVAAALADLAQAKGYEKKAEVKA